MTLVVRGVGDIFRIDAVDSRFTCITGFACNMQLSPSLSNRYLECSLKTPAELSDNERTLTVILDNTEQIEITISGKCIEPAQCCVVMKPYNVMLHVVNDSAVMPTATSVTTFSNTSTALPPHTSVTTSSNSSAAPPLYEGVFKQY